MSRFNHAICQTCWVRQEGDRVPVQLLGAPVEKCCFCGGETAAGIYVRKDPEALACKGIHAD